MILGTQSPFRGLYEANISCVGKVRNILVLNRGELSYLAPLGSENISAPYFKQGFFQGGWYYPPD